MRFAFVRSELSYIVRQHVKTVNLFKRYSCNVLSDFAEHWCWLAAKINPRRFKTALQGFDAHIFLFDMLII